MMLLIEKLLSPEDLAQVRAELAEIPFQDGRATAGPVARTVKANDQADLNHPRVQALETFVQDALWRHPAFEPATRPARLSRLLFSRYRPGQTYGPHTDDALMGQAGNRLRADIAFTLFLAEPDSYEGGALTISSPAGEQAVKLAAGDAIVYPAGTIHYVAPVTGGERLACVGWVQSLLRDAGQREILFDLAMARNRLSGAREDVLLLDKTISNLLRMWAQL
jgi:PKHD-type hydroxylase